MILPGSISPCQCFLKTNLGRLAKRHKIHSDPQIQREQTEPTSVRGSRTAHNCRTSQRPVNPEGANQTHLRARPPRRTQLPPHFRNLAAQTIGHAGCQLCGLGIPNSFVGAMTKRKLSRSPPRPHRRRAQGALSHCCVSLVTACPEKDESTTTNICERNTQNSPLS